MDKDKLKEKIRAFMQENNMTDTDLLSVARTISNEWRDSITPSHLRFIKENLHLTCSQAGNEIGLTQAQVRAIKRMYNIYPPKGYTQSKFGILDTLTGKKYLSTELASKDIGRSYTYIFHHKDRFLKISKVDVEI